MRTNSNFHSNLSFGVKVIIPQNMPIINALKAHVSQCALCGKKLPTKEERTFDHFMPRHLLGKTRNPLKNSVIMCPKCNAENKNGIHPKELINQNPNLVRNLINYLRRPGVKELYFRKWNGRKGQVTISYSKEVRSWAEQLLGGRLDSFI